ncbi:MAG: TLR4 regulator and MIR-interacting MSAP-domain-containing protein [Monoraphidium minutum]|nr:MAG: TLR4 regulator and MIR-interacting MSAP-domain-containing protein [Monoraphidium minutum]
MERLALLLAVLACASIAAAIEEPCSACSAIASELQKRLDAEKPRNHLDLRHRLDKHGKRYGKVIAYKLSELRAFELLDGLCDAAGDAHVLTDVEDSGDAAAPAGGEGGEGAAEGAGAASTFQVWARTNDGSSVIGDLGAKRQFEGETQQRRALSTFCGALVDRHEDEIVAALQGDDFGTEQGVAPVLCERIAKRCSEDEVTRLEDRLDAIIERRKQVPPTPPPTPAPSEGEGEGGAAEGGEEEPAGEEAAGEAGGEEEPAAEAVGSSDEL